jgi:hypothetical protein
LVDWAIILGPKSKPFHFFPGYILKVIFRATHWTRTWSLLFKDKDARANLKNACRLLEMVVMEVFAKFGRKFSNRITA